MIIDLHEKYAVSPEWFEEQLKNAHCIADTSVVEKLCLPRLCTILSVNKGRDEDGAKEAAERMKSLLNSSLVDTALE